MRRLRFLDLSMVLAVLFFAAPGGAFAQTTGKPMTTPSELQIIDTKVGTGASPKPGQTCVMHYTGWLYENGQKGKKFDSSVDRNEPFEFPIGRRARCRRRHSAERNADVRCRIAGGEIDARATP